MSLTMDGKRGNNSPPVRQIGVVSAVFIIFNRIIGTGLMWLVGAAIAAAGMQVYIIWGTALPHNGGEKNYLEHLFPRPRRLITSIYAANAVLLAYAAGNSLVFAEYALASIMSSTSFENSTSLLSPVRAVAFFCLTGTLLLYGLHACAGLRLQNALGFLKIGILIIVVAAGFIALCGNLETRVPRPGNPDNWEKVWEGTRTSGSVLCSCLYNVIWSYVGFSNANYALSEMHNPARMLCVAGPLAIVTVTIFYLLCNIAYFAPHRKRRLRARAG
ncbi:hypothetical protein NLJ89_g7993 [Agrocybe chaxingu]|uniref:Uncharacterized protein n=1 Tax=Agrocybe chaxingu TaxID=84603 RepID=A0A9W8K2L1_9AGAR|nr:hypothetical protein NLJ89_g7993 [Agrocybe chaxingu]